jgi:hypothetical protein
MSGYWTLPEDRIKTNRMPPSFAPLLRARIALALSAPKLIAEMLRSESE